MIVIAYVIVIVFVTVTVIVIVIVMMMPAIVMRLVRITPHPPEHPAGDAQDQDGRGHLEIRLARFVAPLGAEMQPGERDRPHDGGMRHGRDQSQKDRLRQRAPDRNDEGGHHRLGMAGFQSVQRAEQNRRRHEQRCIACALLQQLRERYHARHIDAVVERRQPAISPSSCARGSTRSRV